LGRTILQYPKNKAIFKQGEPSDAVFYIQTGRAKLTVLSARGKEATIALLGEGDFMGEGCIASDQPLRVASAIAVTDCFVLRIEKDAMLHVLHREHAFSDLLVAFSFAAITKLRRIWLISSSTRLRSGWPGLFCCWPASERKGERRM
jgi:CRP-like cAMP-binding protein